MADSPSTWPAKDDNEVGRLRVDTDDETESPDSAEGERTEEQRAGGNIR